MLAVLQRLVHPQDKNPTLTMGGTNSVDRPGTRSVLVANTYADSIVRCGQGPLSRELVAEEANMNTEVSSAPNEVDRHCSQATAAVNSELKTSFCQAVGCKISLCHVVVIALCI